MFSNKWEVLHGGDSGHRKKRVYMYIYFVSLFHIIIYIIPYFFISILLYLSIFVLFIVLLLYIIICE